MSDQLQHLFLQFEIPPADQGGKERPAISSSSNPSEDAGRHRPDIKVASSIGTVSQKYELAIKGVQKHFSHLSLDEIFYPPHELFDAALARQVALYIMHHELAVPQRRLAIELERSREMLGRALRTIETRRENGDFNRAYQKMTETIQSELKNARRVSDD